MVAHYNYRWIFHLTEGCKEGRFRVLFAVLWVNGEQIAGFKIKGASW